MINRLSIGIVVLLTILITEPSSAQNSKSGDLNKLLQSVHNDSGKITAYLEYGNKFERSSPDTAWSYYKKAHRLALKSHNNRGLSQYISHAVKLFNDEGKFDRALILGKHLVSIGSALNDSAILIKGYNDIANDYEYLGSLQEASKNYIRALKIANMINSYKMKQQINNNIASVFIELKNYKEANIYATKSLMMAESGKDTSAIGSSLINLGISEIHLQRYRQAISHFNQTISIGRQVNDATLIGDARINKGVIYTKRKQFQLARREYKQVLNMAERLNMPYYKLYAIFSLAVLDQQNKNYQQAARYAQQAISIGEKVGAADELREMYDTLSVILEKTGDLKGALAYRKKYEILNDSTMSARVRTNINRMQIQYKAAEKDAKIAEQNLQLAKNQNIINKKNILLILTGAGIVILLFFIIIGFHYYRQRQKLQEQTFLNYQKEQVVRHLKAIMSGKEEERRRISAELHDDIGSALTTIMYLCNNLTWNHQDNHNTAIVKISNTASSVVDKMNEIIWSMNKNYDTLDDLISYIRHNSVELLENNGLKYHLDIPVELPVINISGEKRRNIYLVVKESLHNIVKHAHATEVKIRVRINRNDQDEDELYLHIHDNGIGLDPDLHKRFGNGLNNMKDRIKTIGANLNIQCDNGTNICINLPLTENNIDFNYNTI
ncbi:MAG TPA: tetratricopeptide repeat protein [Balneolales bacterium]|nr:tetratricopeptide repeat protein [Balneolales bacterium]